MLFGSRSGDMEDQGIFFVVVDVIVGGELCGVACCMGSGVVGLEYSAMQRLNREIKQQNNTKSVWFFGCCFLTL